MARLVPLAAVKGEPLTTEANVLLVDTSTR